MRILFVCLGNICRSPSAHGVFRAKAQDAGLSVTVDSAGTGGWHIGDPPDPRAIRAAHARGYDLSGLRARQFTAQDFAGFDLIFAMDRSNLRNIEAQRPRGHDTPARLLLSLLDQPDRDLADPYYDNSFDSMLDLVEHASDALVQTLMERRGTRSRIPPLT